MPYKNKKKQKEAVNDLSASVHRSNRATDNEIKAALGLESHLATVLRNAWRRGPIEFANELQAIVLMVDAYLRESNEAPQRGEDDRE